MFISKQKLQKLISKEVSRKVDFFFADEDMARECAVAYCMPLSSKGLKAFNDVVKLRKAQEIKFKQIDKEKKEDSESSQYIEEEAK